MKLKNIFFFLAAIAILAVSGCNAGPSLSGGRSFKRGLAYNDLSDPADFAAIKNGVSWYYSWGISPNVSFDYFSQYNIEFIPMLWGDPTAGQVAEIKTFILAHPEVRYMLVMNEPNLTDQANLTPAQAVPVWLKYEQVKADLAASGRDIKIVGPAMNWGTMGGYGDFAVWLDDFYAAFNAAQGREPVIDYLALHWYDYGLDAMLDKLLKYGKKVWVTEFANWHTAADWTIDSLEKQKACMTDMVGICENRDQVFRYAWFYGRIQAAQDTHYSSIFDAGPGQLTGLGVLYMGLPYTVEAPVSAPSP
jgi:hypothetical protein